MITSQETIKYYDGPFSEGQVLYFGISFIDARDLYVKVDGERLTIDSDYSVEVIKSEGLVVGANITLLKDVAGAVGTVERITQPIQEQDYPESGPFESLDIERGLDKLTMLAQESRTVLGRYIQINDKEKGSFLNTLPKADATRRMVVVTEDRASLTDFDAQVLFDAANKVEDYDMAKWDTFDARLREIEANYMRKVEYEARFAALEERIRLAEERMTALEEEMQAFEQQIDNRLGGLTLESLQASEYLALETKDDNTLYVITPDEGA